MAKKKADSKKAIEPKENISEEENVISPEEFKALEKEEGNKPIEPDTRRVKEKKPSNTSVDDVMLKVEKIEGKLEALDTQRAATDERISRLSEEIGELRSSLLEKERMFNTVETGFAKMKDMTEEINPQKIRKELSTYSEEVIHFQAKIESLEVKLDELNKSNDKIKGILTKIKSFENIVAVFEELQSKLNELEDDKKFVERQAGKVESIFSEINNKMKQFRQYQERIDLNKDMLNEVMKAVDMVELKVEKLATKDDLVKYDERLKQLNLGYDDKVQDMKELMKKLLVTMKQKGFKDVDKGVLQLNTNFASMNDISELKGELEEMQKQLISAKKDQVSKGKLPGDYEEILRTELNKMEATRNLVKEKMQDLENKYFEMVSKQRVSTDSKPDNSGMQSQVGILADRIRKLEHQLRQVESKGREYTVVSEPRIIETTRTEIRPEPPTEDTPKPTSKKSLPEPIAEIPKDVLNNVHQRKRQIGKNTLEDDFEDAISSAMGCLRDGKVEEAQTVYEKANLIYSQLKISRTYNEAFVYYNQIKDLYNQIFSKAMLN